MMLAGLTSRWTRPSLVRAWRASLTWAKILADSLDQLPQLQRKSQRALHEKREALEAFNFATGRISRYLEALCFLAGKDFHAERVRQTSHVSPVEEDETLEPAEAGEDDVEDEGEEPETETDST